MIEKDEELVEFVNAILEPMPDTVHKYYLMNILTYTKYRDMTIKEVLDEELKAMKACNRVEIG